MKQQNRFRTEVVAACVYPGAAQGAKCIFSELPRPEK